MIYLNIKKCPGGFFPGQSAENTAQKIAHGVTGVAKAIVNQAANSTPEFASMVKDREATCGACPNSEKQQVLTVCKKCDCSIWAKIRNPGEQCPDNPPRWVRVDLRIVAPPK